MATRKYILIKQSDRENCLERAQFAVNTWTADWLNNSDIKINIPDFCGLSKHQQNGQWIACKTEADSTLWAHVATGVKGEIHTRLFSLQDAPGSSEYRRGSLISNNIATEALNDLIFGLVKFQSNAESVDFDVIEKPPEWIFKRNRGITFVEITIGGKSLHIAIPTDKMPWRRSQQLPKKPSAITPLISAVSNIEIRAIAKLGEVEISLGQFASLTLGDVIRLPVGIEEPLTLHTSGNKQLCFAYLGRHDKQRALEVRRTKTNE